MLDPLWSVLRDLDVWKAAASTEAADSLAPVVQYLLHTISDSDAYHLQILVELGSYAAHQMLRDLLGADKFTSVLEVSFIC